MTSFSLFVSETEYIVMTKKSEILFQFSLDLTRFMVTTGRVCSQTFSKDNSSCAVCPAKSKLSESLPNTDASFPSFLLEVSIPRWGRSTWSFLASANSWSKRSRTGACVGKEPLTDRKCPRICLTVSHFSSEGQSDYSLCFITGDFCQSWLLKAVLWAWLNKVFKNIIVATGCQDAFCGLETNLVILENIFITIVWMSGKSF